ncbi:uncharacterized protein LOC110638981 [Hevea brasiliensis]|uniref:uncharacterized protein LOC110638981 n=1 Tax=Hevea brasiliensis TaxID=3981 RepID=UPI0025EFE4A3|nr:uncharacterized protein LOC110638981 [Hevea brasiliensis]
MLENQIAQQASSSNSKAFGKLPSQPENPREQCNAVTLRSGKVMGEEHEIEVKLKEKKDECESESTSTKAKASKEANEEKEDKKKIEEKYVPPAPYKPPLPFPQRFHKAQLDKQFGKFLEVLKKLYINIPFTDVISQMPSDAKFLREILSNKRRLEDYETVALTEECSAILQNKLPPKLKDPGSFSIPCHIGETSIERALCDLGASVSLMPLSICEKLKVGDLKPTTISLQLADKSIKYPIGILENVPLKVGKFFIPVDFIVLEMEEDVRTPIILGRPFLATAGANIDVKNGKLKLTVGEEEIEFNLFQHSKEPAVMNSCYRVDVIEHDAETEVTKLEENQAIPKQCNQHKVRKKKSASLSHLINNEAPKVKLKPPSKSLKRGDSSKVCKNILQDIVGILNKATGIFTYNGKKLKYKFILAPVVKGGNIFQFQPP